MDLPVYFISDIHLMLKRTDSEVNREDILFKFLDHVRQTGGTLIINGDLFDFYFEYKDVIPKVYVPFYYQILKLRESGVKVHYVLGNHDYWVMDFINDTLFDNYVPYSKELQHIQVNFLHNIIFLIPINFN